jgi:hypothetical protein
MSYTILRSRMFRGSHPPRRRCLCLCECGRKFFAWAHHLKSGNTKSCGCLRNTRINVPARTYSQAYSMRDHPLNWLYNRWSGMLDRCTRPANRSFKNYGGRGITVCPRWFDFEAFLADVGVPENKEMSLDRFPDNDGNYEPGNVRWGTKREQRVNQRPRPVSEETLRKRAVTARNAAWRR